MSKALALALALGLVLTGCGQPAAEAAPTPEPTAAVSATPAVTPEPTEEPLPFPELALHESWEAGGVIVTVDRAETLGAITSIRNGEGISRNAPEGFKFLTLVGTVKNTGPEEIDADNLIGQVCINGTYTYSMDKYVIQGLLFKTVLPPLTEGTLYLFAEVPLELADSIERCRVSLGFNDGMESRPASVSESENVRSMELAVGADGAHAVTLNSFVPGTLELEERVDHEFISFKFSKLRVMSILRRKYKGDLYSCSTEKDMMILALEGTAKNPGTQTCRPALSGTVVVDGYEYPLREWVVAKSGQLLPLYEAPFYVFAVIPPELAESYKSVEFRIGFNDDFANNSYTDFSACRYEYIYRWTADVE